MSRILDCRVRAIQELTSNPGPILERFIPGSNKKDTRRDNIKKERFVIFNEIRRKWILHLHKRN